MYRLEMSIQPTSVQVENTLELLSLMSYYMDEDLYLAVLADFMQQGKMIERYPILDPENLQNHKEVLIFIDEPSVVEFLTTDFMLNCINSLNSGDIEVFVTYWEI